MLPLLRFTLDLFSTGPQADPVAPAPKARRGRAKPVAPPDRPARPVGSASPPIPDGERPDYVPGVPLPGAIDPAHFAHRQANREVRIGDAVVAYAFTRAKRKSIGFVIGPDGLAVRAPRWTPLHEVDAALQEKGDWILRKLQESRERQGRAHSARIAWRDGVALPFFGRSITVLLDPAHGFSGRGAQLKPGGVASAGADAAEPIEQVLHVGLPKSATPEQIRDAVQAWLMRQALAYFQQRMEHFTPLLGVQWKKLRLSSAGTRWGSASTDGSIRLNWRLIHFRPAVIDYVVAHELSHLRVMNHSRSFWDTVATVVPDYQSLRAQLKEDAVPQW
jgi:predicted metal-dependent hydrolase